MLKQLNYFSFFVLVIVIGFTSCDSNDSNHSSSENKNSTTTGSEDQNSSIDHFIGSNIDTLWVDTLSFSKLAKKDIAFRFYIDSDDHLSLNGWTVKTKLDYPVNPTLSLSRGRKSTLQYKAGYYLGNLLLSKKNITDLQQTISDSGTKYVIFIPLNPDTVSFRGQVTYEIKLTNDDPHPLIKISSPLAVKTDIITNPSPPGTGN